MIFVELFLEKEKKERKKQQDQKRREGEKEKKKKKKMCGMIYSPSGGMKCQVFGFPSLAK